MIRLRHRITAVEILTHGFAAIALAIAVKLMVTEPGVFSAICLAVVLGCVGALIVRHLRGYRFRASKELKTLYADLERINDQHPDGALFVLDHDEILNCHGEVGGFLRALHADGATGSLTTEGFWLLPYRGWVKRNVDAVRVGENEDGDPVVSRMSARPTMAEMRKLRRLRSRTGVDLATADELRALLRTLQHARVTDLPPGEPGEGQAR